MAPSRTRNVDSDGPSTADVSANEDVEMKDADERVDGFNKFGVCTRLSITAARLLWRRAMRGNANLDHALTFACSTTKKPPTIQ
jgi:hypothetical protein